MTRYAIASLGGLCAVVILVAFYAVVHGAVEQAAARRIEQVSTAALANPSRRMVTMSGASR
jgi:hypothetical protein